MKEDWKKVAVLVVLSWSALIFVVLTVGCAENPKPKTGAGDLLEPGQHSRLLTPDEVRQHLPACVARRDCEDADGVVVATPTQQPRIDPVDGAIIAQPGPPMLMPYNVDPSLYKGLRVVPERLEAVAEIDKNGSHTERKVTRTLPRFKPGTNYEGTH